MAVYYDKTRDAWVVDVADEWGRRRRKFLKNEIAARVLEASLKRTIAQAKNQLTRGELPDLKLSEAIALFIAHLAATRSTRTSNAERLAALVRLIGDPPLHDITPAQLAEYQQRRREQISPATLAYEAQVIFRFFRYLEQDGHLPANPADVLYRKAPHTSPGRELTYEEEKKILAPPTTPRIQLRLLLALDAGLRRGEILGLTRRHWQRAEKLLTVWRPKVRKSTTIPLTDRLQHALEEIASALAPDSVINSYGAKPVRKGTDVLKKLRARTAVPFRLHDLRHTFATRLRRVAPFELVRHLLGHAPESPTERYIHPSIQDCQAAVAAMEKQNPNAQEKT